LSALWKPRICIQITFRAAERAATHIPRPVDCRGLVLTLEQKSCAKGGVRTARVGVRTLGVRTGEKVLEHC